MLGSGPLAWEGSVPWHEEELGARRRGSEARGLELLGTTGEHGMSGSASEWETGERAGGLGRGPQRGEGAHQSNPAVV